ncbi:charged multivesicular body protein 6 [Xylariaceae sp. FL0804]|nr:charged multivesicular body protein 6 [Xylariaceae sp. FL0804]
MGNSNSRVTAQDKAILDLKLQRDKLHQYQRRIAPLAARETACARALLAAGDVRRARLALRRKKYQEQLLATADAQLAQLEELARGTEFAAIQRDVVFGLRRGVEALEDVRREMGGLDKIEKLMEDNAEARAYQEEVSEMLGGRITNQDEDEVEDELATLERQVNGPAPAPMPDVPLPDVPDTKLPEPETARQEEQRQEEQPQAERRAMLAS